MVSYRRHKMKKKKTSLFNIQGFLTIILMLLMVSGASAVTMTHSTDDDFRSGVNNVGFLIKRNQSRGLSVSNLPNINGTFSATSLPLALMNHDSVVSGGYIFIIGGSTTGRVVQSGVYSAIVNDNGTLGTWQTLNPLPEALQGHRAVVYDGYIFVSGGFNETHISNNVYSAKINSDGTIGAWQTTTNLPSAVRAHSMVAVGGYLYILGGYGVTLPASIKAEVAVDSPDGDEVYKAPINANGTIGPFTPLEDMPGEAVYKDAFVANGKIWVFTSSYLYYAEILSDGSIGPWLYQYPYIGGSVAEFFRIAYGYGAIFVPGGQYGSLANVEFINSGTNALLPGPMDIMNIGRMDNLGLCTWMNNTINPLPEPLSFNSPIIEGEYLIVTGGYELGGTISDSVYIAQIAPTNGGELYLSSWTTLPQSPLPQPIENHSVFTDGNNIWSVGGYNSLTSLELTKVYSCSVNSDGTITSWVDQVANPLTTTLTDSASAFFGGYAYIIGGSDQLGPTNLVYSSALNSDGSLGGWNSLAALPGVIQSGDALINNGYLYHVGGLPFAAGGGFAVPDVKTTEIVSPGQTDPGGFSATTPLPLGLRKLATAVQGNYIFSFGGYYDDCCFNNYDDEPIKEVYVASAVAGIVGTWTEQANTPLPMACSDMTVNRFGDYVVLGGCGYAGEMPYTTKLGSNGTLTPVTEMLSALAPDNLKGTASTIVNNRIYTIGGSRIYAPVNSVDTVKYSKIEEHYQPYGARYANSFNLGSDRMVNTLRVIATSHPTTRIYTRYRTAPSATGIYSNWSLFTANTEIRVNTLCGFLQYEIKAVISDPTNSSTPLRIYNVSIDYAIAPTITSITPSYGNIGDTVDVTITGTNFDNINQVALEPSSSTASLRGTYPTTSSAILGTNLNVVNSTTMTCRFDLASATEGYYDLTAGGSDNTSATLSRAFQARDASLPYVTVSPAGYVYNAATEVAITSSIPSAHVYYKLSTIPATESSLRSNTPASGYTLYEGPITITEDQRLEAYADNNGTLSETATEDYIIEYQPQYLSVTAGDGYMYIAWEPESRVSFNVYYSRSYNGPFDTATDANEGASPINVSGSSKLLTGLTNDIEYFILLKSVDINGVEYGQEIRSGTPSPTEVSITGGVTQDAYRMISLPYDISFGDYIELLIGELGAYDTTVWRLLKYDPLSNSFKEYTDIESVLNAVNTETVTPIQPISINTVLGNSFWLITSQGLNMEVTTELDLTVSQYNITLKSGWNQIGAPTNFEIPWENVEVLDAAGGEIAPMNLWAYDDGGYSVATAIVPGQGYFVQNSTGSEITLKIPANPSTILGSLPYTIEQNAARPPAPPARAEEPTGESSGLCFIATAAYEKPSDSEVGIIEKLFLKITEIIGN